MATRTDFQFERGQAITIVQSLASPQSILGWTFSFTVRSSPTSSTALITKTSSDGISVIDAINGAWSISLSASDTSSSTTMPAGTYYWHTERTDSGSETVLSYGKMLITEKSQTARA